MPRNSPPYGMWSAVRPAAVLAALLLILAVVLVYSPDASAAPFADPIPGSPLDARQKGFPYDVGVHEIARLAALVAYGLMVAAVVFGVVLRLRFMQHRVNRATIHGAHMTLGLSALIFAVVHGMTFLYQPVWGMGPTELIVPFAGGLQRIPVGLGILGTELCIAVGCSVLLQRRLGYHRWLRFHQLAYAAFLLIWLHIFLVHPEPRRPGLVAATVAGGAAACLLAFLIRVFPSRSRLREPTTTITPEVMP
ncbi:ferric reductase-like transmembrane domain-containing protein [Streptomyces sp. SCSIO 30461]|uniref:ferric reductase-like transmembrane domain-containing protein n=1 Tax=Streptomyces sp. SCSIO 30461 TaxID=3118085 RepID=UPI0030CE8B72